MSRDQNGNTLQRLTENAGKIRHGFNLAVPALGVSLIIYSLEKLLTGFPGWPGRIAGQHRPAELEPILCLAAGCVMIGYWTAHDGARILKTVGERIMSLISWFKLETHQKALMQRKVEEGINKGIKQGIEQGREQGIQIGQAQERAKAQEAINRWLAEQTEGGTKPISPDAQPPKLSEDEA